MVHNLDRIERVINKIVQDLGLGNDEIPYHDFVEWIADGLQHIGGYYQFEERECHILINDYHGMLPCDFYKPVRFVGGCSINPGSGGFYGGTLQETLNKCGVDYECLPAYERFKLIAVPGLSKPSNNFTTEVANRLQFNKNLIGNPEVNQFTSMDYNINFNKVTAAFRYGVITLQYLAFAVDEKGWPLIPDDVSYRDALFWKVAYHLSMRDPRKLPNPRMQDMEYCKQKWNYYCVQARASANMPDLAMMERLKNNWLHLHNVVDLDTEYYREAGKQQHLGLDGRH